MPDPSPGGPPADDLIAERDALARRVEELKASRNCYYSCVSKKDANAALADAYKDAGEITDYWREKCGAVEAEVERLRADAERKGGWVWEEAARLARGCEPENGWGSRTAINDAWADGFLVACVQLSDLFASLGRSASGGRKESEAGE